LLAILPDALNNTTYITRPGGELGATLEICGGGIECNSETATSSQTLPIALGREFMTPILQIKSYLDETSYLSVRTFGETVLSQVKNDADGLKLFDISRFTRADLGGHLPMDVDLDPHTSQFTMISSNGVISNFDFHEGRKHSFVIPWS
jgi:hypothetical protein